MNISEAIDKAVATVGLEALKKEQREAIESFVEAQEMSMLPFRRAVGKVLLLWCATTGI